VEEITIEFAFHITVGMHYDLERVGINVAMRHPGYYLGVHNNLPFFEDRISDIQLSNRP
jgi:hypothetical protein